MKNKYLIILITAVIAVIIVFSAYVFLSKKNSVNTSNNPQLQTKVIKVGYQKDEYATDALVNLAEDKGYFKKYGLKIEKNTAATNVATLLKSGDVDVTISPAAVSVLNYLNGEDNVFVDQIHTHPVLHGFLGRNGNKENFYKAGVAKLAGAAQIYTEVVKGNLGTKSNIDYSVMASGAAQVAALKSGALDFAITGVFGKDISDSVSKNGFQVIYPENVWKGITLPVGVITTRKKIESDKNSIKGFISAMNEAENFASNNKSDYVKELSKEDEINADIANSIYNSFSLTIPSSHSVKSDDFRFVLPVVKGFDPKQPNRDINGFYDNSLIN